MSISSCPRCAKQIAIPEGVSQTARVRCPLCNEEYTLADVLVHVPPMLVIVEEASGGVSDEWLAPQGQPESTTNALMAAAEPGVTSDAGEEISFDEELAFDDEPSTSPEIKHADVSMQAEDNDTDVEELEFATSAPLVRDAPEDLEPLDVSSAHDDTVFELDTPGSNASQSAAQSATADLGGDEIEVDLGEFKAVEEPEARHAATVEFQEINASDDGAPVFELESSDSNGPQAEKCAEEDAEIEFGEFEAIEEPGTGLGATVEFDPANPPAADHDIELDFGTPQTDDTASGDAATVEFEHRIPASDAADVEEIELDFGEAVASEGGPEAVEEPADKAKGKKGRKAKKKKASMELGDDAPPRRSLVGTFVSVMLGAVVAVPLTLYGLTWLGKDYDFLKLGPTLASYKIPVRAEYSKGRAVAVAQQPIAVAPPAQATPTKTPPATENPPADTAALQPADAPPAAPSDSTPEPENPPPTDQPPVTTAPAADTPAPTEPTRPLADEKPALAADEPTEPPTEPAAVADRNELPSDEQVPVTAAKPADVPAIEPPEMPDDSADAKSAAKPSESADDAPKLDDQPPVPPDEPAIIDAPQFSLADLAKAMQETGAASQKLLSAQSGKDDAALKTARTQFYLKMFAMAEALTFTNDESADGQLAGEKQAIEQIMLHQFASEKKRLDALKYNAGRWLDFSKRTTPGVVVAGTVQSCEPSGKLYEVKLGIGVSTDDPIVTVLHKSDPQLVQGDQALLLGAIVDDPGEKVIGYEGLEPMAIWSGMTIKLPAAK